MNNKQKIIPECVITDNVSEIDFSAYTNKIGIVDKKLYYLHKDLIDSIVEEKILLDVSESSKNIDEVVLILKLLTEKNLDRHACIVGIGGGVIGDISGFIASIYMRGIDFIQIPSTYMSMCDHVIGKVAISNGKKNVFGSFYSPRKVIIVKQFLDTLPKHTIYQGVSEVLKHYFITGNKELESIINNLVSETPSKDNLIRGIELSHQIKAKFVLEDPFDNNGMHKALSYGHTFANAIETKDKLINHGEAVLKGMILAARLSSSVNCLDKDVMKKHNSLCKKLEKRFLKKIIISNNDVELFIKSFKSDKISCGGKINFVILKDIGSFVIKEFDEQTVRQILVERRAVEERLTEDELCLSKQMAN